MGNIWTGCLKSASDFQKDENGTVIISGGEIEDCRFGRPIDTNDFQKDEDGDVVISGEKFEDSRKDTSDFQKDEDSDAIISEEKFDDYRKETTDFQEQNEEGMAPGNAGLLRHQTKMEKQRAGWAQKGAEQMKRLWNYSPFERKVKQILDNPEDYGKFV